MSDSESQIPSATVARLVTYLDVLTRLSTAEVKTVSSNELAEAAGANPAQLRKDLSHLGSYGTRGVGYGVDYLRVQLDQHLGAGPELPVIVIGLGNLGRALVSHSGFTSRGFQVVGLVDADPMLVGQRVEGMAIVHDSQLEDLIRRTGAALAVVTTPVEVAQTVADRLVASGITGILNFAPTALSVPPQVTVRKVDLGSELQLLAYHCRVPQHGEPEAEQPRSKKNNELAGADPTVSILVLSASHHTASLDLLSQLTLVPDQRTKVLTELERGVYVDEALVLSTCNRTEVYAAVSRFHGGLEELAGALSLISGVSMAELQNSCAVSYDERAVQHAFAVASGMESMVRGEQQILGQVRSALTEGQRAGTVGTSLNSLFQQALRVGKRVHHETAAGSAGRSLVSAALDRVGDLQGVRTAIIGAGTMSSLAVASAHAAGADLVLLNRTRAKAERLAGTFGAQVRDLAELPDAIADAEVLISCTGGRDLQLGIEDLRGSNLRKIVDLGLPADVSADVSQLPGLELINLQTLAEGGYDTASEEDLADALALVADEVADFLAARRAASVTPTVVALRTMATEILDAELARLNSRTPGLTETERAEVGKSMRRVVEKLLHQPTVRVRQLSGDSETDYAGALRELFALDPETVRAVGGADLGRE